MTHLSPIPKAMILAFIGFTAFAFADTCVKYLTQHYDIFVIIGIENFIAGLMLLACAPLLGGFKSLVVKSHAKIHAIRIIFNFIIAIVIMKSFSLLPLADVYTMIFVNPLIAALIAIPLFGEQVTRHRWIAIFVGFAGVLIAFRPGSESFDANVIYPLIGSFFIACLFLSSRKIPDASPLALGFYPLFGTAVLVTPFMIENFELIRLEHMGVLLFASSMVCVGMVCCSLAFRMAPSSAVSPLMYTEIIWGVLFGYLIFTDLPDSMMLTGAFIIILSGLYLVHHERKNA